MFIKKNEVNKNFSALNFKLKFFFVYLGYANEIGEAFRAWVPLNLVRSTYLISSAYALADGLDKSHKTYKVNFEKMFSFFFTSTFASLLH